ncbi:extracellular solute-binding protein [Paenibacillus sp. P32E]|uniref:extracellular solute-binding protein n=1 Tax=Paenibacillus sp. P32E TaxID=1349434 RepID=UPI00093F08BF
MNIRNRSTAIILVVALLAGAFWMLNSSQPPVHSDSPQEGKFAAVSNDLAEGGYEAYLKQYKNAERPDQDIRIEGEAFSLTQGEPFEVKEQFEGLSGAAVITPESGTISWDVPITETGLYNIRIHYYPIEGKSSSIERSFAINQKTPFKGADSLLFDRVWGNREAEVKRDDRGNDLRPRQVEKPVWQSSVFADSEGFYEEPYSFYLEKGNQNLSLTALREPMAIDYIELFQDQKVKSYSEVKQDYEVKGLQPVTEPYMEVQAEAASAKSSPTLYPLSDHSSPTVVPYHVSSIRINTIGGVNWKLPGQWIEWQVNAPEDGLYQIALKEKQDQLRGVYANRSLTIDGEYPFKEMKQIRFNYSPSWKMNVLGGEEPYLFHLTKGTHTLRLTVTLGDIAPLVRTIQSSVLTLNEMYRNILAITSNNPDKFRDYQLEKRIPDMTKVFREQADIIRSVGNYLEQATGERSDKVSILYSMVTQLEDMVKNPGTVAKRLTSFKTNVGGLGTWILTVQEQPLTLDSLIVSAPGKKLPRAQATFFQKLKHELGAFTASYTADYDSIGNVAKKQKSITVWISTGRDQAQVMKSMIDDTFTPDTNISVSLRLVPPNILLPATLAGEGPDVAMQIGEDLPVNYAMRKAAADLSGFADFKEVTSRFRDSALTPYKYNGNVYGLPEQQIFPMLFYRKDILQELGLEPPKTWQDVYNVVSVLQRHNLEFYLPLEDTLNNATLVPNAAFTMLLYQNGGQLYTDDQKQSALDSEISMAEFNKWTQFYTNYKFPVKADFPNRFRTGEMPIGIADYTIYNSLTVMAPEIRNLWEFTLVPGTPQADGTVDHSVASHTTGVMLLENAKDKNSSWEFMKWWTDKATQVQYGREMEGLMGAAARYPTANIEALEELPWPVKDYINLESQWQWVKGNPQVPGGYFTGRHLDNAFRKVVNGNVNPREALSDYLIYINDEIQIKRKEFKLPY